MGFKWSVLAAALAVQAIIAAHIPCPIDSNCDCRHNPGLELDCKIDGRTVQISLMPDTYLVIKCINTSTLNYDKLPKCANPNNTFKSVTFKNCPLPPKAFQEVLKNVGVSKTFSLIFQNSKNISGYFDRKHFTGLQNLTKLLISVKGLTQLPDDLFEDIDKLQWLNIRSNRLNLTQKLFKPLGRLETLEISHNHMTNISSNLFSHMSLLKKLSLWQDNVTWFSKDMFMGADVLEELDLSSSGLDELPESIFEPLKMLKKLTLFSNKFSSLPKDLFQSNKQLETVIMLNNDVELRKLPEKLFGNSESMRQVYLQRCGLEVVPYNLFEASSLILAISLAHNNIRTLPEKVFIDQINLQELDLSSNRLENLSPHVFCNLLRLQILNLSYNSLTTIDGITFNPLISLQIFNMDHNNLQFITSLLFIHNIEKLSISIAYNQLDLESDLHGNQTWRSSRKSPFAKLYNLKLLNVSHNNFKHTFKDWWENGHDSLDISYNQIEFLRNNELEADTYHFKEIKEVRISNNRLQCSCINTDVIDFIQDNLNTKMPDFQGFDCPFWTWGNCNTRRNILYGMIILTLFYTVLFGSIKLGLQSFIYRTVKRILNHFFRLKTNHNQVATIVVEFANNDDEFVHKCFLPELKFYLNLNLDAKLMDPTSEETQYTQTLNTANPVEDITTNFVIFTPNYLALRYAHVGIKKIRGEMKKENNKVFIFVNTGAENAVHTFLMQGRDPKIMILWEDVDLWKKIKAIIKMDDSEDANMSKHKLMITVVKKIFSRTSVKTEINSQVRLQVYPENHLDASTTTQMKIED